MVDVRRRSMAEATQLGYSVSMELPLLGSGIKARDQVEILNRCLVLHPLIAVSYGFPRESASRWLEREGLTEALSPSEVRYLENADPTTDDRVRGEPSRCGH